MKLFQKGRSVIDGQYSSNVEKEGGLLALNQRLIFVVFVKHSATGLFRGATIPYFQTNVGESFRSRFGMGQPVKFLKCLSP
ncbi:MAG TPA: hypothetical protein VGB89_12580 [Bacteroidota bacterium]